MYIHVYVHVCTCKTLQVHVFFFPSIVYIFRAVQLHQKLSSPLRKKSTEQCIKTLEEKQVKAELFREKKKEEMAQKSKSLSEKVLVECCTITLHAHFIEALYTIPYMERWFIYYREVVFRTCTCKHLFIVIKRLLLLLFRSVKFNKAVIQ